MFSVTAGIVGILFGVGLPLSDLPEAILTFLTLGRGWQPGPGIALFAAAVVTTIGYAVAQRRASPLFAKRFELPDPKPIDRSLVVGAGLFGVGWGIAGICPGPAVAGLTHGNLQTVIFLIALIFGLVVVNVVARRGWALQGVSVWPGFGIWTREARPRSAALSAWRRWVVVAAATFGMASAFSMSTSIAVFMKPFESEFGWMRADIAFAFSLLSAGAALGGLVSGRAFDLVDVRPIVVFGALASALGFTALSQQNELPAIQTIYLAIGVFGFSCLYTPLVAAVGLWFDRSRGLAIGIVTAGGTLGQGFTPLILQPLVESYGWRYASLFSGIAYLALLVPAMLLVTKPPKCNSTVEQLSPPQDSRQTLPTAVSVGWLGLAAVFCCASMAIPVVHLVALLGDRGHSAAISGSLIITIMLAASVGRIGFGLVADRLGGLRSYALAVAVQTATVYWFVQWDWLPALYGLAVVFGLGYGGVMTTLILSVRSVVTARVAGLSTSIVGLLAWGGMAVGGFQGGYCFDLTGSYATAFLSAALAGFANLLILAGFGWYRRWVSQAAARSEGVGLGRVVLWPSFSEADQLQSSPSRG
jgi:MFS family permease